MPNLKEIKQALNSSNKDIKKEAENYINSAKQTYKKAGLATSNAVYTFICWAVILITLISMITSANKKDTPSVNSEAQIETIQND